MTYQFKIQIKNISKPTVWRRVEVPATCTFDELHIAIQLVFNWENCHMYMFSPKGYGSNPVIALINEDDWEKPDMDALETTLSEIFNAEKQTFVYTYDFGDDWIHSITLEKIIDKTIPYPVCLAGKGACPFEDCGGAWGYEDLKLILTDPSHKEHKSMRKWYGLKKDQIFDPEAFDKDETNGILKEIFG